MASILVVDDLPANREILAARLVAANHRVRQAASGAKALAIVRADHPDLVIADILMPEMDGYEFVRQLRADAAIAATPVIFYTATYDLREAENLAQTFGVTRFLPKPFEPGTALRAVEEVLSERRSSPPAPLLPDVDRDHLRLLTDTLLRKVSELEAANGRLTALIELGRSLALERDPQRLLANYCHAGRAMLGARYAVLGVPENAGPDFRHWLTSGFESEAGAQVGTSALGDALCRMVVAKSRSIQASTSGTETSFLPAGAAEHSILVVPIASPMHRYGLLGFAEKVGDNEFSAEDEGLAVTLGAQLAVAYENARRQEQIERNAGLLEVEVVERQRAETTLRESEKQFRQLTENIREVFWLADLETERSLYVSPAYDEIWGRSRADLYTNRWAWIDSIHAEDLDRVKEAVRTSRTSDESDVEYRIVRPDGTERWIRDRSFAVPSEPGTTRRIAGLAEDITEEKQDRAKLEQYAERLANLRRIDRAILAAERPQEIAATALHHLRLLVPCWHIGVWIFDFESGTAEVLAAEGGGVRFFPGGTKVTLDAIGLDDIEELKAGRDRVVEEVFPRPETPSVIRTLHDSGVRSHVRIPVAAQGELIGTLILCADHPGQFGPEHLELAHEIVDQLALCVRHAFLFDEVHAARERQTILSRRLLKAQEEERRHIARELHDEIGQSLTAVKIDLQRAKTKVGGTMALPCLEESDALIDHVLQQVRTLSLELRPSVLDDLGLVAALRWYLDRVAQRAGFVGRFVADPPAVRSTSDIETACFRAAQEALTNVTRHARAREVHIALKQREAKLELVVRDDGVGFDVAEARRRAASGSSLGLLGMQERITYAGGQVAIDAAPGRGTEIRIEFPLRETSSKADPNSEEPER